MNRTHANHNSRVSPAVYWLAAFFLVATLLVLFGTTGRTRTLIANTLRMAAGTMAIGLPIGTILAWTLCRTNVPFRRLGIFVTCVMLFMPLYLQTAGWDAGFGDQGWFQIVGDRIANRSLLSGWRGAIWVHGMASVAWVALIVTVGFQSIAPEWEEAASLEAGNWLVFRTVVLPHLVGSIVVAAVWILVTTAGEITVTDVFQIRTYAEELYIGYARNVPEAQGANVAPLEISRWVGIALTAWLALGALVVCVWLWPARYVTSRRSPFVVELGAWRWVTGAALIAFVIFWCGVPIGNLFFKLGITVTQVGEERIRGWSLVKAGKLLASAPGSFQEELGWTLLISQAAALAAIVLGVALAWLALLRRSLAVAIGLLLAIMMATPGPTLALLIIRFVNQPELPAMTWLYDRTIFAPWLGIMIRCLPIVTLVLWVSFRTIPAVELETAELAGVGRIGQLFRIVIPQRFAAIACAWFVCVALATGELTASILLVPPGITTLAIRIFGLVHYGVEDRLAALCLCSILLFAGFATAVMITMSYWRRQR